MLNFAATVPHSPVLIPAIGNNQTELAKKTTSSLDDLAQELKKFQPHTLVIVSPHGPMRYDKFTLNLEESFKGSFSSFGIYDEIDFNFLNNQSLTKKLLEKYREKGFPVDVIREHSLDYGTLVPLFHLIQYLEKKPRIIPLTFTAFDWQMHYQFGKVLGQVFSQAEENITFISSADLSGRIREDSPAGFSPYGLKFDQTLMELLEKNQTEKILKLNPEFCNEAGECGLKSIIMALGVISELPNTFQKLSYESPLGVGYLVGRWKLG